jgi:ABC-type transport system involved in multi-copper enzyme maturation permease subunit
VNRGLIIKALRELWPATLLLGCALFLFEGVLAYVLPTFAQQFSTQWLQMKFAQTILKATLGAEVGSEIGPDLFTSIPWVHPVVLAITWAHAIIICTRVPAGEVDRGTVDVLLGLPISRWELFRSETVACVGSGMLVLLSGAVGNVLGGAFVPPEGRTALSRMGIILLNLMCLYMAACGMAWMLSALSDRRGKAIAAAFIIVIASFLLNYLAQLWQPAQSLEFLSVLHYYRPLFIMRVGNWPLRDMTVLLLVATMLWIGAGVIFARRDLSTT